MPLGAPPQRGLADKPEVTKRRWLAVAAVVVLLGLGAIVADRAWFSDPDFSIGSRHHVTVRVIHPCERRSFGFPQFVYGGRVWWIAGESAEGAGISLNPPASGTLLITGPLPGSPEGRSTNSAVLLYRGGRIPLEGGGQAMLVECGIH